MFQLGVAEHIRLSLDSMLAASEGHAAAAARLAHQWWYARVLTLASAAATAVVTGLALQQGRALQVAAAAAAATTLAACAAYVAFDPSPRIYGHRASAARLWLVCENYRTLLGEMHDQSIDTAGVRERRSEIAREAAAILEQAPPTVRYSFELPREPVHGARPATPNQAA